MSDQSPHGIDQGAAVRGEAVAEPKTIGELFASVGGWMNGGDLGYPSFGSMEALKIYTQRAIRGALSARAADAPSEPSEDVIGCGNPEAFFVDFCEVNGYPSDGEMDAALRSAFYEGIKFCAAQPRSSRAADALDSRPTALPNGWEIDRGDEGIELRSEDGRYCVYSPIPESPAHRMTYEFLEDLFLASSQPTDGGVRNGWVLVPTKYTPEMRAAWDSARSDEDDSVEFANAWQAILAASRVAVKANEGAHE